MTLDEYARVYAKMRDTTTCSLLCPNIIMHYYFNTGHRVPIVADKHGNTKNENASNFRPKEHSLKQSCKKLVQEDSRAPRLICQEMQEKVDVLESFSDSSVIRDPKQISNYRQTYGPVKNRKHEDAIRDVIFELLEQSHEDSDLLDKNQSFIQELLLRHGKQAGVVAYLQQTLKDIERFCTTKANPFITSPLSADTTFNIAEYLLTQTTYRQLSVLDRGSLKHPWFPGPLLCHRNQAKEDFAFLWQAVKRGNPHLTNLLVLGTDEDEALSGGILQETNNTIDLLGKEHVFANVEKKLTDLNFPLIQRRSILADIFEGPESLYESPSELNTLRTENFHIQRKMEGT
ncbi:uncharacterized protein LOC110239267 isoform X1 [Exaiptasia diaphana]|uniref:Uncharacterized protein n=1 Tax=Exaiptasia diaphana TaxID=2652724 RepID=A0A913YK90_EXADI|nr:uncharacterized protein LOC110239267 isoform X1 [Exaiptasia diaphana]